LAQIEIVEHLIQKYIDKFSDPALVKMYKNFDKLHKLNFLYPLDDSNGFSLKLVTNREHKDFKYSFILMLPSANPNLTGVMEGAQYYVKFCKDSISEGYVLKQSNTADAPELLM
jgi:hypothetical protein